MIDEIRDRVDIVRVIGEAIPLKKAGRNFVGLCPFHGEKTPSFSVSQQKQLYYCFGCGEGGTVFTFLMKYHRYSFPEVLERLAQMAGIDLTPYQGNQEDISKRKEERNRLEALMAYTRDAYHKALIHSKVGEHAREYVKARGISWETAQRLKLGFAPDRWSTLTQALLRDGKSLEDAERLGLVVQKKGRNGHFDQFRNRLLFPIEDPHGKVVGFGGRVLGDDEPKYLNSPQSLLFDKSKLLYGLDRVTAHAREEKSLFVVEGYMDQVVLGESGIHNVVATLGTALTDQHARLLKRYAENVVIVFDGDSAGLRASRRSMKPLLAHGVAAKVMLLPEGEDPDSFVRKVGREKFLSQAEEALPMLEFFLDRFYKEERNLGEKAEAIEELVDVIRSSETLFLKEALVEEASRIAGLDKAVLRGEQKLPLKRPASLAPKPAFRASNATRRSREEWATILRLAARVEEARRRLDVDPVFDWFPDEKLADFAKNWLDQIQGLSDTDQSISGLVDAWGDENTRQLLAGAFFHEGEDSFEEDHWEKVWKDCVKKLLNRKISYLSKVATEADRNGHVEKAEELSQEVFELKKIAQHYEKGWDVGMDKGRLG